MWVNVDRACVDTLPSAAHPPPASPPCGAWASTPAPACGVGSFGCRQGTQGLLAGFQHCPSCCSLGLGCLVLC